MSAISNVLNRASNGWPVTGKELLDAMQEWEQFSSFVGHCFRHNLRFAPNEAFNNNCPACYWEHEAAEEAALREKMTPKR